RIALPQRRWSRLALPSFLATSSRFLIARNIRLRLRPAARKGSPSSFGEPRAARPRAWSDPISRWQKLQGLRGAFSPASRYPPQRGPCHGNHSRKVSRPTAAEEGVCESGYAHAGWIAAGDAGLVRLQGWSRSGEHREGTSQSAQLEERRAR